MITHKYTIGTNRYNKATFHGDGVNKLSLRQHRKLQRFPRAFIATEHDTTGGDLNPGRVLVVLDEGPKQMKNN